MSIAILLAVKNSTVQDPTMRTQIHDMQKYPHPALRTRKCSNGLPMILDERIHPHHSTGIALHKKLKAVTRFKQVFHHKDEAYITGIKWSIESTRWKALH